MARGDGTTAFQFHKGIFNQMPQPVEMAVVLTRAATVAFGRSHAPVNGKDPYSRFPTLSSYHMLN